MIAFDLTDADHVFQRLKSQIRIHRTAAVTDQQGEVVYLTRFTGFQHQANLGARARANQVMIQAGDGQQGGNGRLVVADAPVGKNEDVRAAGNRAVRFRK